MKNFIIKYYEYNNRWIELRSYLYMGLDYKDDRRSSCIGGEDLDSGDQFINRSIVLKKKFKI